MSFFRSIRSSISRGRSSSRDASPARPSRPGSVTGSVGVGVGGYGGRRDSLDSRADSSVFNRSDTFILASDAEGEAQEEAVDRSASNTSTLEKKSKKLKVLSKFSTFTKRKKSPSPSGKSAQSGAPEHHPSENATNTYYKWQSEAPCSLDYDPQSDPFHFLYEQPSTLRALQNAPPYTEPTRADLRGSSASAMFDSATYRKAAKAPPPPPPVSVPAPAPAPAPTPLQEPQGEADKYRTVTINSFRKSFRERFLAQQKEAPHNPAWFVEVEPPEPQPTVAAPAPASSMTMSLPTPMPNTKTTEAPSPSPSPSLSTQDTRSRHALSKENRPDFLVFENDNYRPGSRSPVRDPHARPSRSATRSPVKRNETFRVDRPTVGGRSRLPQQQEQQRVQDQPPSIRIEIKNSITPNLPGRMVPVGVAKPMPSPSPAPAPAPYAANYQNQRLQTASPSPSPIGLGGHSQGPAGPTKRYSSSPLRSSWSKPVVVENASPVRHAGGSQRSTGRYQTLVQIRGDSHHLGKPASQSSSQQPPVGNRSSLPTRIHLNGSGSGNGSVGVGVGVKNSPTVQNRFSQGSHGRHPLQPHHPTPLTSYELLRNSSSLAATRQKPAMTPTTPSRAQSKTYFGSSAQVHSLPVTVTSSRATPVGDCSGCCAPAAKHQTRSALSLSQPLSQTTAHGGCYASRRNAQPPRLAVPVQRRSRSPIKMPWR